MPILLTDEMEVSIVGRVVELVKEAPCLSSGECLKAIRRAQSRLNIPPEQRKVEEAVRGIAPMVENGRQWFAVYRALCDRAAVPKDEYHGFAEMVARIVPDHPRLPVASELMRLAVDCFRRPVGLWSRTEAPVKGKCYEGYLRIARRMLELLS